MTLKKAVPIKDKEKIIQIDCTDLVILRWFVDFYPNMKKISVDGKEYAWLTHKKLIMDLPLLDISKRACIERMQKLVEFGILDYKLLKDGGTFSLYAFGANYIHLVRSNDTGDEQSNGTGGMRSNGIGCDGQTDNKDSSISNPSNNNSSIKDKGKEECKKIVDLFNSVCKSYPAVRSLTKARVTAIKARLNKFTIEDFQTVFENAEASSFLKGINDRGWSANFDWLINETNMVKVLEGNFVDKGKKHTRTETKPGWMVRPSMELGQAELDAIQRALQEDETDPEFMAQAEEMQKKMQEKYGRKAAD
jgi:hypothetical protein